MQSLKKKTKGITLIALVVTIIVLLILAGIAINLTVGNNGLFSRAESAANEWKKAELNEQQEMTNFEGIYDNTVKDLGVSGKEDNGKKPITQIDGRETDNTETKDKNGNRIVVPAGFKVVNPNDTVDKGIVIEDVSANDENTVGNQFVWIPVSHVNGKENNKIRDANGNECIVELARYTFDTNGKILSTLVNGETIASAYKEETEIEHMSSAYGNKIANNIDKFKESVNEYGGYYISRYEAGDNTSESDRTEESSQEIEPVFKENEIVYNCISQPNASTLMKNLYENQKKNYISDLVNSYSWDTAIVFIQNFSGDSDYSKQNRLQANINRTGMSTNGTNKDVRCNIYDMAGNVLEWTTETCLDKNYPCVHRGGFFNNSSYYTSYHGNGKTTTHNANSGFRGILYINV